MATWIAVRVAGTTDMIGSFVNEEQARAFATLHTDKDLELYELEVADAPVKKARVKCSACNGAGTVLEESDSTKVLDTISAAVVEATPLVAEPAS